MSSFDVVNHYNIMDKRNQDNGMITNKKMNSNGDFEVGYLSFLQKNFRIKSIVR